ncbi:MAG TPA: LuxR C-terminal-related transcriptional regulator [Eudoraea sp.]|nr:LuxR C-terminal-related transcriptional regulator [Eudoraea sp.]
MPPIQNYRVFEYNAAGKNWDLSVNVDGELFVANNSGLLHYNGEQWVLYNLPNNTTIRSVASVGHRIYTGSYEEFGYWTENELGLLEYTSLIPLIKDRVFKNEDFWEILSYGEEIIFRSFSAIYRYRDDKITVVDPRFVVSDITIYKNRIMVTGGSAGIYELADNTLIPIESRGLLQNKAVNDMITIKEGLLIGTKLEGCFLYKDNSLTPWEEDVNGDLQLNELNKMLALTNGKIAFGTIKDGVYIYDPVADKNEKINRKAGLQNNTVLSLLQFREQLWLGLDNGIDRIQLNNPLSYYTDFSGTVGTVYDLAMHEDVLYMGSNTGIYYFRDNELTFVEGSQGHVWDLEVIDDELFCGHNTGTFKLRDGNLEKVSDISGGYRTVKIPQAGAMFLQGTYTGLAKYHKNDLGDWVVTQVREADNPVKYLCFEDAHTLWAAHPYKGVFRMKLNAHHDEVVEIREFNTDEIPNIYNIKLYSIKNQIVLWSEGTWYKYDPILGEIIVFEEFQSFNHKNLIHYGDEYFWFIDHEASKEVIYTNLREDYFVLDDAQLQKRWVPEAENMINQGDSVYYFTLSDGFGELNLSKFRNYLDDFELPTPRLSAFKDIENRYAIGDTLFAIPYKRSQDIGIEISAASMGQPRYYYELKGPVEESDILDNGTIHFQNLPFGNYQLNASTISIDNKRSVPKVIHFEIAPPWYLSWLSLAFYALALLGVVFLIRWYNRRKLERRHNKLKEQLHREQEERLAQLEKEKLAKEIKLKQKELASTTMNVAKKNELILELKNLLLINKEKFSNQQRYRSFMKKLNSSINDDEDWRHFEVNFKELHEDFFEVLLNRYKTLTPKDLKLCAYLKMNLSSKEIAPLMGISTRGVEIHRYRLRKKLRIDGSQNISNFLITLR